LAYDLRQIYARLVGFHLTDACDARKSGKFYEWFKALEDIKTITLHKFKKREESIKEFEGYKTKITNLSIKYPTAFTGENKNPQQIKELDSSIRELEEWIYFKMEEGKVFGEAYKFSGL
jgi:hypothetical protein